MKVVILCTSDYANFGYIIGQSLKSVGFDAVTLKTISHRYKYIEQAQVVNYSYMKKTIMESDIVIFMHSEFINTGLRLSNKKVFVIHGGGRYRNNPKKSNDIFNRFVRKSLIQTGDLLGLGARNEVWIMGAINTNSIKMVDKKISNEIIISHFPSKAIIKGTDMIERVIKKLKNDPTIINKFKYICSDTQVSWSENLKRMSECDIYLDACQPKIGKAKYGEFGIAALEAAAMGKIIVTHFMSSERYKKEFGEHPIQVINSESDIENVLRRLLNTPINELQNLQFETRKWVETMHSYKAMGTRLKKILLD